MGRKFRRDGHAKRLLASLVQFVVGVQLVGTVVQNSLVLLVETRGAFVGIQLVCMIVEIGLFGHEGLLVDVGYVLEDEVIFTRVVCKHSI